MVSPIVQQSGTVTVNGSTAYVAGSAVDLDPQPVACSTLPAQYRLEQFGPACRHHRVAGHEQRRHQPRHLSGCRYPTTPGSSSRRRPAPILGFDTDVSATRANQGTILVSSGYNISSSSANLLGTISSNIGWSRHLSRRRPLRRRFHPRGRGQHRQRHLEATPRNSPAMSRCSAIMRCSACAAGATMTIPGYLLLDRERQRLARWQWGGRRHAAQLDAENGSTITIGGDVTILANASGYHQIDSKNYDFGAAQAGTATLQNVGSTIGIGGSVTLSAVSLPPDLGASASSFTAAPATGGTVNLTVSGSGTTQITGDLTADVSAKAATGSGAGGVATGRRHRHRYDRHRPGAQRRRRDLAHRAGDRRRHHGCTAVPLRMGRAASSSSPRARAPSRSAHSTSMCGASAATATPVPAAMVLAACWRSIRRSTAIPARSRSALFVAGWLGARRYRRDGRPLGGGLFPLFGGRRHARHRHQRPHLHRYRYADRCAHQPHPRRQHHAAPAHARHQSWR